MGELLFAGCFLLVSLSTFVQGFNWSGWNRGFLGLYGAVIVTSVSNFDSNQYVTIPHFDSGTLNASLGDYVKNNMAPYSRSTTYTVTLGDRIPYTNGYSSVKIAFRADLGFRILNKTASFRIEKITEDHA